MSISPDEGYRRAMQILASDIEVALQKEASKALSAHKTSFPIKRTGHLIGSIKAEFNGDSIDISFPYYAKYLEFGTGLYGPFKTRITPKEKQALAWGKEIAPGKKQYVFKSVAGMHPAPFIRPVFHQQFKDLLVRALNEGFEDVRI